MSYTFQLRLCICLIAYLHSQSLGPIAEPEDLVNLLAGSFTDGQDFSTGNTLPLVGMPWGFNHWAPQTRRKDANGGYGGFWFDGNSRTMNWIRCTHQPSPWLGDYGWFVMSPQLGIPSPSPEHYWQSRSSILKPHIMDISLAPFNIRFRLAPTTHGAIVVVNFPSNSMLRSVCFDEADWFVQREEPSPVMIGLARQVYVDALPVTNFGMHIHIEAEDAARVITYGNLYCFEYTSNMTTVTIRMATSLISGSMAQLSLDRELPLSNSFDDIAALSRREWNGFLKRVDVVDAGPMSEDASRHLSVFYTGLYRALTFPRRTDETDSSGKTVHYSPFDPSGRVHEGPGVTDNGFWDTFRTVYPLLSLLYPDKLGPIIQGWLNAFTEGGWLPSWASPGYRNCMVGTFADVVIADAIVKNIKGFDLLTAYEALNKDAFSAPPPNAAGSVGKHGLEEYRTRGYISSNGGSGADYVSRTIDFAFADWSTANAFEHLIKYPEFTSKIDYLRSAAKELRKRSYTGIESLFSSHFGLLVPRRADGRIREGFDTIDWGHGYIEGNAWHHSFPPFALRQLADLHGGNSSLIAKLEEMLSMHSNFKHGEYGHEIHEMREGRVMGIGQYGHNNQPSHHVMYLFALLGDRASTERNVRTVLEKSYGRDFFAGDDDNGELGAWFVLSALGLYSVNPGVAEYVLGSPLFKHVRVDRYTNMNVKGRPLNIIARGTAPKSILVESVSMNDKVINGPTISDADVQGGGTLRFVMKGELFEGTCENIPDTEKYYSHTQISPAAPEDLVNLVSVYLTDNHTLPLVGFPWGFNHWAPQTTSHGGRTWFSANNNKFHFIRCTHQVSSIEGDYGWFTFGPSIEQKYAKSTMYWQPRSAIIRPHLFDAVLAPHAIRLQLAPTMHGAAVKVTFQKNDKSRHMCFNEVDWMTDELGRNHRIIGISRNFDSDARQNFGMYIVIDSDVLGEVSKQNNGSMCFTYNFQVDEISIRIATSFISDEQAIHNLNLELPLSKSFDDIAALSRREWNGFLKRVDVVDAGPMSEDASRHLSVFYTGLYRALTFPRRTDETDSSGKTVHYSPFDPSGRVHEGPGVTDNGFWDTFRTVYPLLSLLYPDKLGPIIQGWLNAFKESGYLSKYSNSRKLASIVIADAIVKKIKGFDLKIAFRALEKDSFITNFDKNGKPLHKIDRLHIYINNGYLPLNISEDSVSLTLDFAYADWSTARAFEFLRDIPEFCNDKELLQSYSTKLYERSSTAIGSLFSAEYGLIVPKDDQGIIFDAFDAFKWGEGYREGNAWHYSFPPFAIDQLVELHGGASLLVKKLKLSLEVAPFYNDEHIVDSPAPNIGMGQYMHTSQQNHLLYLFSVLGDKNSTEVNVRKLLERGYGRDYSPYGYESRNQGAWFVLSAIGLFPITLGSPEYVLGTPLFKHIRLRRYNFTGDEVQHLDIVCSNVENGKIHVDKVFFNHEEVLSPFIQDFELQRGGYLLFTMKQSKKHL